MMGEMVLKNEMFLELLDCNDDRLSDFVSVIELLKNLSYRVILSEDLLEEIYELLYKKCKTNEDIKILSRLFDKMFSYLQSSDFEQHSEDIGKLLKEESNSLKDVLDKDGYFDHNIVKIGYMLNVGAGLRNVSGIEELRKVLLIFSKRVDNIKDFVTELRIILSEIIFDEDIEKSIEELNDGFAVRKGEIIFHLYCIQKEIPKIIEQNITDYQNIGDSMSLDCSPERDREIVKKHLTKQISGNNINCELHTKMRRISNKAPDRIYFCPCVPNGNGEDILGKILIYKITKHV